MPGYPKFFAAAMLAALLLLVGVAQAQVAAADQIVYNKQKDTLTVTVKEAPLARTLAEVGRLTGVAMLMDLHADRPITATFKELPLKDAVMRLTGRSNTMTEFKKTGTGKNQRNLLVKVVVLPEGQTDVKLARPLVNIDTELDYRAGAVAQYTQKAQGNLDLMVERWKSRLPELSAAQRKAYDERMKGHAERAARKQQRENERAAQRAAQEKAQQEKFAHLSPEQRPQRKPSDPVLREKARQQFQQPVTPGLIPDE